MKKLQGLFFILPGGREEQPALIDPSQAHSLNTAEILIAFQVDPEAGMDPEKAGEILKELGPNQLDPGDRIHGGRTSLDNS